MSWHTCNQESTWWMCLSRPTARPPRRPPARPPCCVRAQAEQRATSGRSPRDHGTGQEAGLHASSLQPRAVLSCLACPLLPCSVLNPHLPVPIPYPLSPRRPNVQTPKGASRPNARHHHQQQQQAAMATPAWADSISERSIFGNAPLFPAFFGAASPPPPPPPPPQKPPRETTVKPK